MCLQAPLYIRTSIRRRAPAHRLAGIDTFYREAGDADAPVLLLPHG